MMPRLTRALSRRVRAKGAKDAWARVTKEIELYKTIIEQAGIKKMQARAVIARSPKGDEAIQESQQSSTLPWIALLRSQ